MKKENIFPPKMILIIQLWPHFRILFGGQNDDNGGYIWIHEGVWEYMAGRGYMENKNIFPPQILFLELQANLGYFFGGQNDDSGGHIWIHEGVWEYMGGRGYVGIRGDECGRPTSNIKWLRRPF